MLPSSFNVTVYFYPRSPCGERLVVQRQAILQSLISIHALLAESDSVTTSFQGGFAISIHALLAESDGILGGRLWHGKQFLSTLSLRRATLMCHTLVLIIPFLSTLSLRRATIFTARYPAIRIFLSTLSLRRATPEYFLT